MFKRMFQNVKGETSILGFGCMRMPRLYEDKSDIDYEKGKAMIDRAMADGVNYFDTAYPYHEGKSELFIGAALKEYPRESFYLANKIPVWNVTCEEDVERIFNEQLEKCQVDYFDFYLAHALNMKRYEDIERYNIYTILKRLKEQGKIRNLGFSFHDKPPVLEKILNTYEWDFAQLQINYLDWELQDAKRQYELVEAKGIPVIIMEPVRGGSLAELCPEAVEILKEAEPNISTASWAIRYAASFPNVLTVLSGMSTMEQVEDNLKTTVSFKELTKEERIILDKALEEYKAASTIPCTACRYCMDCPAGVDIPKVFAEYNHYRLNHSKEEFVDRYVAIGEEHQAHNCISCGICVDQCPQSIQIPEKMKEIAEMHNEIGA